MLWSFLRSLVFDWFDWTYSEREWSEKKKVTLIGRIDIFSKNEPWRKKGKTVSFQSTNQESMVKSFLSMKLFKNYCLKILQNKVNLCFWNELRYRTGNICKLISFWHWKNTWFRGAGKVLMFPLNNIGVFCFFSKKIAIFVIFKEDYTFRFSK